MSELTAGGEDLDTGTVDSLCLVVSMFVQLTSRVGHRGPAGLLGEFLEARVWENGNMTQTRTSWTVPLHSEMTFRRNTRAHSPLVSAGIGKLASVPAGGAVAVSAAPGSAAPAAGSAPAAGKWRFRQLLVHTP